MDPGFRIPSLECVLQLGTSFTMMTLWPEKDIIRECQSTPFIDVFVRVLISRRKSVEIWIYLIGGLGGNQQVVLFLIVPNFMCFTLLIIISQDFLNLSFKKTFPKPSDLLTDQFCCFFHGLGLLPKKRLQGMFCPIRGGFFILQLHDELLYEVAEEDVVQVFLQCLCAFYRELRY